MYLGDNMLQQDLEHVRRPRSRPSATRPPSSASDGAQPPAAQILLAHVDDPRQFGVAEVDARRRRRAPRREAGRSAVGPRARRRLPLRPARSTRRSRAIEPSARGELEITDAIQWLIDHGHRVRHEMLAGLVDRHRQEGPAARLQPARARDASSRASTARSTTTSRVERPRRDRGRRASSIDSIVRGPAIIGAGTRLVDTYVGPYTSIAADCELVDAEIEHSVVLERSRIIGVHRIQRLAARPRGRGRAHRRRGRRRPA